MAIHSLALNNPGAESANTSGWTLKSGAGFAAATTFNGFAPHSGTYMFVGANSTGSEFYQNFDVTAYAAAIDGNTAAFKGATWLLQTRGSQRNTGTFYIECYAADGVTRLYRITTAALQPLAWTQYTLLDVIPIGTRFLRIGTTNAADAFGNGNVWDDFTLELSDDATNDYPTTLKSSQMVTYPLVSQPAALLKSSEMPVLSVNAAETSSGDYLMYEHQVVAYALVRGFSGYRNMRAYTFPQDNHDFYCLNLGTDKTLIIDLETEQWSTWSANGIDCWRPLDGLAWEQDNVGGDYIQGLIWSLDPDLSLDDDVTGDPASQVPITSIVRGMYPQRLRNSLGCFRAVLTVSQGAPAAAGVGIQLRTSDDMGVSWQDQGFLLLDDSSQEYDIAWASLGQIVAPGRIFEITDTGFARRLEALDVDLGPEENQGNPGNYGAQNG